MIKIPDTVFAGGIYQAAWDRISEVHAMFSEEPDNLRAQLIYGSSGAGKTFLLKSYQAQFPAITTPEKKTVPVFYVALKESKKSTAEITRLLIAELGGPVLNSRTTAPELDSQLITLLKGMEVELIIIDEIQNIASSYDGIEFQRIIKYFCYLIDSQKIRCSIVFAGTSSAIRLLTFGKTRGKFDDDEQMSRRHMRPIEITPFLPRTQNWVDCCNWFVQKVGLPPLTPKSHHQLLDRIYLAYSEHTMSTLRDLFFRNNTRRAKDNEQLIHALMENFEKYATGGVNPFDYEATSDIDVNICINTKEKDLKLKRRIENEKNLAELR